MLRRSPPNTLPPNTDVVAGDEDSEEESDDELGPSLTTTSNGVRMDASERTPLLGKDASFETHHPDWISGQRDIERQDLRRRVSWPRLRNIVLWPKEKGVDIARTVLNPKSWDRKVIWQTAVIAPTGCLPAVVLGLLLNILDALSYGACINPQAPYVLAFLCSWRNQGFPAFPWLCHLICWRLNETY